MYRQQNLQTYVKYFYPQTDYFIPNFPLPPFYEKEKGSYDYDYEKLKDE